MNHQDVFATLLECTKVKRWISWINVVGEKQYNFAVFAAGLTCKHVYLLCSLKCKLRLRNYCQLLSDLLVSIFSSLLYNFR